MRQALWQLLNDFLSAILFLVVYLVSGNLVIAAALAIAVGVAQLARLKLTGRPIEPMQWMSLGLVRLIRRGRREDRRLRPAIRRFPDSGAAAPARGRSVMRGRSVPCFRRSPSL